jgi:hypothetical protein
MILSDEIIPKYLIGTYSFRAPICAKICNVLVHTLKYFFMLILNLRVVVPSLPSRLMLCAWQSELVLTTSEHFKVGHSSISSEKS